MQNKKEVLIIEENNEFITKLKNSLENKVDIISMGNIKQALEYYDIANKENLKIDKNIPDVVVIGNGCRISKELQNIIQTRIPQICNTKTFETFEPVYYCNLFKHMFKKNFKKNPKTCICADLEQYPIIGNNQDITKKLSYCIQHNIPLMDKNKENEDLILSSLKEYIMRACKMNEEEIYK